MNTAGASTPSLAELQAACALVPDPEFGVSITDLGLIHEVVLAGTSVSVALTLTSPHCPAGNVIADGVRAALAAVPGVTAVEVRLVWEPAWTPERVNARGREALGWRED
jgi:metal-sulfur cluster biosynthetic enzyme